MHNNMETVKANGDGSNKSQESIGQTGKDSSKGEKTFAAVPVTGRSLKMQKRLRFQPENVKFTKGASSHEHKDRQNFQSSKQLEIPRAISVADRVESGVKEMKAMLRAVSQHTGNRAALQKIPRHMRRRAASHNRKRLPRRLHQLAAELAANSQSEGSSKAAKPPCRKKRRRKRDLQNEFQKRAEKQGWLETHMWHAKRFHMTDSNDPKYATWGNRVALHPNDKSFRACYRAVAKHCLIQDMSYMRCLQISGGKKDLVLLFQDICGVEFDELTMQGQKEVEVIITRPPHSMQEKYTTEYCIGPASVLWRPESKDGTSNILLWLHPTISSISLDIMQLYSEEKEWKIKIKEVSGEIGRFRLTGSKSSITLLSILRPLNSHPPNEGKDDEKKSLDEWMESKKYTICQLHKDFVAVATGCHRQIFARRRTAADANSEPEYSDGSVFPVITDDPRLTLPLDKTTPSLAKSKEKLQEHMSYDTDDFADTDPSDSPEIRKDFPIQCCSPLWVKAIRDEVAGCRKPDHLVSTRKHQQMFETDRKQKEIWRKSLSTAVPVIAIRKLPNQNKKLELPENEVWEPEQKESSHHGPDEFFAAGWDLIVPKNWATAFWIPLIYHRARAGGLRENKNINLESLRPHFPEDFPDTAVAKDFWNAECEKLAKKYYRKPPAKRPNCSVLAVPNPFKPDWAGLNKLCSPSNGKDLKRSLEDCRDCEEMAEKRLKMETQVDETKCKNDADRPDSVVARAQCQISKIVANSACGGSDAIVSVLRDEALLVQLKGWILKVTKTAPVSMSECTFPDAPSAVSLAPSRLIFISVTALSKGIPFSRSTISLPTAEDLDELCEELTDPYKYGLKSVTGPVEPKHWDPYRKERKEARKLARKSKKSKATIVSSEEATNAEVRRVSDGRPPSIQPRRFPVLPSREAIGYVTSGDFLYTCARGAGVGFVASCRLISLAKKQASHQKLRSVLGEESHKSALLDGASHPPLLALMRNADSAQYRFVKLDVIKP